MKSASSFPRRKARDLGKVESGRNALYIRHIGGPRIVRSPFGVTRAGKGSPANKAETSRQDEDLSALNLNLNGSPLEGLHGDRANERPVRAGRTWESFSAVAD